MNAINMIMGRQNGRWLCVMGDVDFDGLATVAERPQVICQQHVKTGKTGELFGPAAASSRPKILACAPVGGKIDAHWRVVAR